MFIEPKQENIWEKCLEELKGLVPDGAFYTWFPNLEFHEMDDSSFVLGTPNDFVLDYVSQHYRDSIQGILNKVSGLNLKLKFTNLDKACQPNYLDKTLQAESGTEIGHIEFPSTSTTTIDTRIDLNPDNTFDNFVVGDCNQFAHAACKAVSESPNQNNFNPLVL